MKKIFFLMSILTMLITASCVMPKTTTQKPKPFITQGVIEESEDFDSSKLILLTVDLVIKNEWNREFLTMPNKTYYLSDSIVLRYIEENKDTVSITFPKYAAAKCFAVDTAGRLFLAFEGLQKTDRYLVFGTEDPDEISDYHILVLKKEKQNKVKYGDLRIPVVYGVKRTKILINPDMFKAKHTRMIKKGV